MKFEENIREKLEDRKIEPSAKAWDLIEQNLDTITGNNQKSRLSLLLVAAVFAGVIFITGLFVFNDQYVMQQQLVEQDPLPEKILQGVQVREEIVVRDNVPKKKEEEAVVFGESQTKHEQQKPDFKNDKSTSKAEKAAVATAKTPVGQKLNTWDSPRPELDMRIDQEVDKLLATVDSLEKHGTQITDVEVQRLLTNARELVFRERLFQEQTRKVSATALLQDVETELDQSFREKIFDALKDGFYKARDAVASRND